MIAAVMLGTGGCALHHEPAPDADVQAVDAAPECAVPACGLDADGYCYGSWCGHCVPVAGPGCPGEAPCLDAPPCSADL